MTGEIIQSNLYKKSWTLIRTRLMSLLIRVGFLNNWNGSSEKDFISSAVNERLQITATVNEGVISIFLHHPTAHAHGKVAAGRF